LTRLILYYSKVSSCHSIFTRNLLNCPHLSENATPEQKKDFLEEINLMTAVGSHMNIVSLIGCCTKSTPNFLIVEFAAKGDLLSYLRERRTKVKKSSLHLVRESGLEKKLIEIF